MEPSYRAVIPRRELREWQDKLTKAGLFSERKTSEVDSLYDPTGIPRRLSAHSWLDSKDLGRWRRGGKTGHFLRLQPSL